MDAQLLVLQHSVVELQPRQPLYADTLIPSLHQPNRSQPVRSFDDEDWVRFRPVITRKYIRLNQSLKDIMLHMKDDYGLSATLKQYKTKFKHWQLDKYLRTDEVLAMMRVKAHRDANQTSCEFWRHGRLITTARLDRILRDNSKVAQKAQRRAREDRSSGDEVDFELPPHIIVLGPMRALKAANEIQSLELTLKTLQSFLGPAEKWTPLFQPSRPPLATELFGLAGVGCLSERASRQMLSWRYLDVAFKLLQEQIETDPFIGFKVAQQIGFWTFGCEAPEVARMLADYTIQVCRKTFPEGHPWHLLIEDLFNAHDDEDKFVWSEGTILSWLSDVATERLATTATATATQLARLFHDHSCHNSDHLLKASRFSAQLLRQRSSSGDGSPTDALSLHVLGGDDKRALAALELQRAAREAGSESNCTPVKKLSHQILEVICHAGLGNQDAFGHLLTAVLDGIPGVLDADCNTTEALELLGSFVELSNCLEDSEGFDRKEKVLGCLERAEEYLLSRTWNTGGDGLGRSVEPTPSSSAGDRSVFSASDRSESFPSAQSVSSPSDQFVWT